ncbi:uncharacterized protein LOC113850891 [Abrus precatorius]|uniref:Uncharacterized protein LOC113850891 n=1 Tax=Abrus precatorius TaxID=3816 RepID=A0A8B8K0P5_ABRPR|nr:uncharacterized protein LOC113850891 [Abrus precatorius]
MSPLDDADLCMQDVSTDYGESNQVHSNLNSSVCMSYKDKVLAIKDIDLVIGDDEIIRSIMKEFNIPLHSKEPPMETDNSINLCPELRILLADYESWCSPWKFTLIVKLLGKSISFNFLKQKLNNIWGKNGNLKILDLNNDFFLVKFENVEDYKCALFEGSWLIMDHYLLVQRWRPPFWPQEYNLKKLVVWVHIPDLPLKLYNENFLWQVSTCSRTMLKIDSHASLLTRGHFARICVEIDLNQKLIPSFKVLGQVFRIEYEGLYLICFHCGKYGHRLESCVEMSITHIDKISPKSSSNSLEFEKIDESINLVYPHRQDA